MKRYNTYIAVMVGYDNSFTVAPVVNDALIDNIEYIKDVIAKEIKQHYAVDEDEIKVEITEFDSMTYNAILRYSDYNKHDFEYLQGIVINALAKFFVEEINDARAVYELMSYVNGVE